MRKARSPTARTHTHEALLCFPVEGLRADVARLALRIVRALFDCVRDGLLVLFVGIVLFRAAATLNLLTKGLVGFPVPLLAVSAAVAELADPASKTLGFEGGSALGAFCEDHCFLRQPQTALLLQ